MNSEFNSLCEECQKLKTLLEEQKESGLPKGKWFSVIRLLIDVGRISLARKFSSQSEKHDYESERYIDNLTVQRKGKPVRCTELGCSQEDIQICFKTPKKNNKGEIMNSPSGKIRLTHNEKRDIGFYFKYREIEETDEYDSMNPNIFVRHILKNYKLLFHESGRYYMYIGHCWKSISDFKLQKILRFFFDKFEPDVWRMAEQNKYFNTLRYEW